MEGQTTNAAAMLLACTFLIVSATSGNPILTPSLSWIMLSANISTGTRIISYLSARSCSSIAGQYGLLLTILHNVRNDYVECSRMHTFCKRPLASSIVWQQSRKAGLVSSVALTVEAFSLMSKTTTTSLLPLCLQQ